MPHAYSAANVNGKKRWVPRREAAQRRREAATWKLLPCHHNNEAASCKHPPGAGPDTSRRQVERTPTCPIKLPPYIPEIVTPGGLSNPRCFRHCVCGGGDRGVGNFRSRVARAGVCVAVGPVGCPLYPRTRIDSENVTAFLRGSWQGVWSTEYRISLGWSTGVLDLLKRHRLLEKPWHHPAPPSTRH